MKKYYFVGIKGSGMSALAQILKDRGYEVIGSDIEEYVFTEDALKKKEIKIIPFDKNNIKENDFIYVIGNSFNSVNSEEVREIVDKGFTNRRYTELLAEICCERESVGVAGIHGKTSVTNILSQILPMVSKTEYLIGDGRGKGDLDSNSKFVFEACEYKNTFLNYRPNYAVITNLGFDHPDFFKNEKQVYESFSDYVENVREQVLIYGDDKKYKHLENQNKLKTFGMSQDNDYYAKNVEFTKNGISFTFCKGEMSICSFKYPGFGKHSLLNILAAISMIDLLGYDVNILKGAVKNITMAKRRFNVEKVDDNWIVNDYAHHPTEIESVLDSIKHKFPNKRVALIFQPHTYSRTKKFSKEYQEALGGADEIYLCDIFSAKRENYEEIDSQDILKEIGSGKILSLENISVLNKHKNQVIAFLGAGDIEKFINCYKKNLNVQ